MASVDMDFIWNDGGRAICGFVGQAGDCVTRAISIATGTVYRDVYQSLGTVCEKSPRNGVRIDIVADYLKERGWTRYQKYDCDFGMSELPKGVVIVHLGKPDERCQHLCTVVDHVIYDTWNPADDEYVVKACWIHPTRTRSDSLPIPVSQRRVDKEQEVTQQEFDKILRRLKALDNTANNRASTDGEKHNALRMMQNLMLRHNLTREDIVDNDNVESVQFTRIACPVNGRRACAWERMLASYMTRHVFTSVQWYHSSKSNRTFYWFYGPLDDVRNAISLFRELLLTIATAAQIQYGGYVRGSGASYAEGYVAGLPRPAASYCSNGNEESGAATEVKADAVHTGALIQSRTLALTTAANEWLYRECNVRLVKAGANGRNLHDPAAANRGKQHGAKHEINAPGQPLRIPFRR